MFKRSNKIYKTHFDRQFRVERQPLGPLHQFVDDRVSNLTEFVRQFGFSVEQFIQLKEGKQERIIYAS